MPKSTARAGTVAGVVVLLMSLAGVFYAAFSVSSPEAETAQAYAESAVDSTQEAPSAHPPVVVQQLSWKTGEEAPSNLPETITPLGQPSAGVPGDALRQRPGERPNPSTQPAAAAGSVAQAGSPEAAERRRVQIQDAFRNQMTGFRECYDLILELEPSLDDRLVLELLVRAGDPDPTTELVSIESRRMDFEHISCFAEVAAEMEMPAPEGEAQYTIRYPIVLTTE